MHTTIQPRGRIPADSVSFRKFYFILYLTDDGKICIGTQYLGQFGGYQSLLNTLLGLMEDRETLRTQAIISEHSYFKGAVPKEVRVDFVTQSASLSKNPTFTSKGVIAFRRERGNETFFPDVEKKLFPLLGQPPNIIKNELARLIKEDELIAIDEQDIQDCSIVVTQNKRDRVIHMMNEGSFASRFHLNVPLDDDGLPVLEPTKKAMRISLAEDVIEKRLNA